jgi:hypothetical protein
MEQSLQATIESALIGAKNAHHLAVEQGIENDDNWPAYYAEFIVRRLVPLMTAFQSEHTNTCPIVKGYSGESLRKVNPVTFQPDRFGGPGWIAQAATEDSHAGNY